MDKKIWFIDDDEVFAFIIQKHLEGTEFEHDYAQFNDGDVAILEVLRLSQEGKELPRLIIMDLNMSHLDGWQALDLLNEFDKPTQVVIVTSSLGVADRSRANNEPLVVDYLVKPIKKEELISCIKKHLSQKD